MEENNDDTRQGLYNEFESEIVKAGNPEAYFDENDLVEIFDYASDMDNYIVKMEVLLYGARHYPGSEVLATRRAWFYSSFGEMEAAAEVNSRVSNGGFLNLLLALRAEGATDTPATRERLGDIIDSTADMGDEDVIQLVDFCAENNMLDWIEENRARVEAKCSYTPTFIYEYADRAEDVADLATAQALFEELTMMEPFTVDFWVRLARVQYDQDNDKDALASADYALAVEPTYADALRVKGKAMFRLGRDLADVALAFKGVLADPSATDTDYAVYAATLHELGQTEEAVNILEQTVTRFPLSQAVIDVLMKIDFERATPYIVNVAERTSFGCDTVIAWAKEHIVNNRSDVAVKLVELFADKFMSTSNLGFLAELWYLHGKFRDVVNAVHRLFPGGLHDMRLPEAGISFPYVMSLARLGQTEKALSETQAHLARVEADMEASRPHLPDFLSGKEYLPATATCHNVGYTVVLRSIINALQAKPALPPDSYDPHLL